MIKHEILDLAESGPNEDELEKGKKYLIGSYALRFDTSTKIAGQLRAYPDWTNTAPNGSSSATVRSRR